MSGEISNPHDRYFRELVSEPQTAAEIARQTLPSEVLAQLDLSNPTLVDANWIDPDLQAHFADVLYQVPVANSEREAFLLILFEHKSHLEPLIALQILRYMVQTWQQHLKENPSPLPLPVIIPLVFYHGLERWSVPLGFEALFDQSHPGGLTYVPKFEYALLDLSANSPTKPQGDPLLRARLAAMQVIFSRDFRELLVQVIRDLPLGNPRVVQSLETILIYVKAAKKLPESELANMLREGKPTTLEPWPKLQFFEDWKNEARAAGLAEALAEGELRGEHSRAVRIALRLLQRKFHAEVITLPISEQIQALSLDQLDELAEAVLEFQIPEDLFRWLEVHQPPRTS